jgi:hypothetical protein
MKKHIVMYSGGACSWAAAKRVVERHGKDSVTLLFADTMMEDEDLYRFLDESVANVGAELVRIADGRNPWEVMRDKRFIANSRVDPCSEILKRKLLDKWRDENCDVERDEIYLGLSWDEQHRVDRVQSRAKPWKYSAPMAEEPFLSKSQVLKWIESEGIKVPRLYSMGFPHNNCGGFCVKAGQAHFAHLLRVMPERFAYHEAQEQKMRELIGDRSILKRIHNGETVSFTLKELRERIENQMTFDQYDWGGCGCAIQE